eukprot:scaffold657_cov214-Amphora_coffeaeformis.AAC.6
MRKTRSMTPNNVFLMTPFSFLILTLLIISIALPRGLVLAEAKQLRGSLITEVSRRRHEQSNVMRRKPSLHSSLNHHHLQINQTRAIFTHGDDEDDHRMRRLRRMQEIASYWTPTRIHNAIPKDVHISPPPSRRRRNLIMVRDVYGNPVPRDLQQDHTFWLSLDGNEQPQSLVQVNILRKEGSSSARQSTSNTAAVRNKMTDEYRNNSEWESTSMGPMLVAPANHARLMTKTSRNAQVDIVVDMAHTNWQTLHLYVQRIGTATNVLQMTMDRPATPTTSDDERYTFRMGPLRAGQYRWYVQSKDQQGQELPIEVQYFALQMDTETKATPIKCTGLGRRKCTLTPGCQSNGGQCVPILSLPVATYSSTPFPPPTSLASQCTGLGKQKCIRHPGCQRINGTCRSKVSPSIPTTTTPLPPPTSSASQCERLTKKRCKKAPDCQVVLGKCRKKVTPTPPTTTTPDTTRLPPTAPTSYCERLTKKRCKSAPACAWNGNCSEKDTSAPPITTTPNTTPLPPTSPVSQCTGLGRQQCIRNSGCKRINGKCFEKVTPTPPIITTSPPPLEFAPDGSNTPAITTQAPPTTTTTTTYITTTAATEPPMKVQIAYMSPSDNTQLRSDLVKVEWNVDDPGNQIKALMLTLEYPDETQGFMIRTPTADGKDFVELPLYEAGTYRWSIRVQMVGEITFGFIGPWRTFTLLAPKNVDPTCPTRLG